MKIDKYKQIRACRVRTGSAVKLHFHSQSSFISFEIIDLDLEIGFQL